MGEYLLGKKTQPFKRTDKIPVGSPEIQSEYQAISFLPFTVIICKRLH